MCDGLLEAAAAEIGIDPVEMRRKNILREGRPQATGTKMKDAAIEQVLDAIAAQPDRFPPGALFLLGIEPGYAPNGDPRTPEEIASDARALREMLDVQGRGGVGAQRRGPVALHLGRRRRHHTRHPRARERAGARERLGDAKPDAVDWRECTAAEIDGLPAAGFDACVAAFVLSEMSTSERAFVLEAARQRLRPGGVLAVGDEVVPRRGDARALVIDVGARLGACQPAGAPAARWACRP